MGGFSSSVVTTSGELVVAAGHSAEPGPRQPMLEGLLDGGSTGGQVEPRRRAGGAAAAASGLCLALLADSPRENC